MEDDKKISHYELLYILSGDHTIDEAPKLADKIKSIVSDSGAKITYEEDLGKKKLAYPIKRNYHGYYELLEFNLEADKVGALNNVLRLMPEVIRHQIVNKKEKTLEELAAEKKSREAAETRKTEELKKELEATEEVRKEEPKPREDKKSKLSLEDLDKKLDEILDDTII